MAFVVVKCVRLVEQARLDGEADGGVRNRLELDPAALPHHEDRRIADVVRAHEILLDLDDRERRGGAAPELPHRPVGPLEAVEDRVAQ